MPLDRNTFIPRRLEDVDTLPGITVLSRTYFRVANELCENLNKGDGKHPGHFYVFPAVMLYSASIEAYFQERLSIARYLTHLPEADAKLDALRDRTSLYRDFKPWLQEVYRFFDRGGEGFDLNSEEYRNVIALQELRNTILHYNPAFIEHVHWPVNLQEAVRRSKIEILNAGWVTNLSSPPVAKWAHDSVRTALELFAGLSGVEDVFSCAEPFKWE